MNFYESTNTFTWSHLRGCLAIIIIIFQFVVSPVDVSGQGNQGQITSFSASDAPNPGDTINMKITLYANTNITNSNIEFLIIAPNGTVVKTHKASVPKNFGPNESWSHSWSTTNVGFPSVGTYSVIACWSTGQAKNCDIAQTSFSIYSVPTLGWLFLPLLGMVFYFLWQNNAETQSLLKETHHGLE